jgi:hypothetical protein
MSLKSYTPRRAPIPAKMLHPSMKCSEESCRHSLRIHGKNGCLALRCGCHVVYEEAYYDPAPDA